MNDQISRMTGTYRSQLPRWVERMLHARAHRAVEAEVGHAVSGDCQHVRHRLAQLRREWRAANGIAGPAR